MSPQWSKFSTQFGGVRASVVKNLFIFIGCLVQSRTVNLNRLKDDVGKIAEKSNSDTESHYKRLSRFLLFNCVGSLWYYILVFGLELLRAKIELLYLDATEWQIGRHKIHILVLAIDFEGIAIAIYFQVYHHKGVLSEQERIKFLETACGCCPIKGATLIGDGEFIGPVWFKTIVELELNFICRVRKEMYKDSLNSGISYQKLQKRALKKGRASSLVSGQYNFRLWMIRKDHKDEIFYILTSLTKPQTPPNLYRLRWKIELLFKHLKTNGYQLEDLRITNINKIRLLFSMLVLAFICSVLAAKDHQKNNPVKQKVYKDGKKFDAISAFKKGQSILKQRFITLTRFMDLVQFLNVTIKASLPFDVKFVQ